jgi:hypothetical protein
MFANREKVLRPYVIDGGDIQAQVIPIYAAEGGPMLKIQQRVRITHGPLSGLVGIVKEVKTNHRVVVAIMLAAREIDVELDISSVSPLTNFGSSSYAGPDGIVHV